jgi:2-dehydro-3-deoxyphosphooctonate aldolase (KDO 8-P synthase)
MHKIIKDTFQIGTNCKLALISGPCVIESEDAALFAADALKTLTSKYPISFIFKSSFDKANRSSIDSFRGPGLDKGIKILQKIQKELAIPITTDVHTPEQANIVGNLFEMVQIPAFLCRQTDLLVSAAKTPATINIKKGQFMSPFEMINVIEKVTSQGKDDILLTDRGTFFGYNNLVNDFRSIPIMQKLGYPVCFDATHSVQTPGAMKNISGGQVEFVPTLTKAAIAAGANAIFIEAHPDPKNAKSDKMSSISFEALDKLLQAIIPIFEVSKDLQLT